MTIAQPATALGAKTTSLIFMSFDCAGVHCHLRNRYLVVRTTSLVKNSVALLALCLLLLWDREIVQLES